MKELPTDIDSLLDAPVFTLGSETAAGVSKRNYRALTALRNVMTHSTRQLYHECPRKWQFTKMNAAAQQDLGGEEEREDNVHFAYGHAIGAGVATYDATLSLDEAIWAAFLAWDIDLLAVGTSRRNGKVVPNNKTFAGVVWALKTYGVFRSEETELDSYEVVENEATILIDWEDGWFDSMHIDSILRHKVTGKYKVKENKTTALATLDPAMYSNSEQALGYSIGVDMLPGAGQEYDVVYCIYLPQESRWVSFEFPKNSLAKVEWIQDQQWIHQQIEASSETKFFPKRGSSCWNFGRRCDFYESCDIKASRVFGREFAALETGKEETLEQIESYTHRTTLTQILARLRVKTQLRNVETLENMT